MGLTENAVKVLEKRYLAKDENGKLLETPDKMFRRVASAIAQADKFYDENADVKKTEQEFYEMMSNLEFLPNSPTLMNAGRPLGQLSACFVLPIEDSMEGIFEAIKQAAMIHKSGGGTGFSFSRLRPKGSTVNSTGGVASGPISFMKVFNAATEAVKQGGTRRGANMGILRVDHPDIIEFITCKQENTEINNFNISVGITEKFMQAVESDSAYDLIDPHSKKPAGKLNAREVFKKIVDSAWQNGEPGIIFLDRLNKDNVVPEVGEIESTNPCGEQPLLPYESCNLGSINLALMVKMNEGKVEIDYEKLAGTVQKAVHFLDNVINVNQYPLQKIDEVTKSTRKIGLGVMGFADLLFKLGIPYNSSSGVQLAEKIMHFISEEGRTASMHLAEQRGTFPLFEKSIYKALGVKVRNATVTTIAPTGTLSIIAGVSSGVEPVFALSYIRNVMDNDELVEVNPIFNQVAVDEGFYSEELMKEIAQAGHIEGFIQIPQRVKEVFVTAHEISPEWHIKMQAAFQKYTDNAVSKTVNFKNEATREEVAQVFELAYKTGCKGVTIYRDGSRDLQVLNIGKVKGKEDNEQEEKQDGEYHIMPRPRPEITTGFTEKVGIGCGNLYITVNYDQQGICEVFTNTGRAGGCPSQSEATSRLVSIALRSGMEVKAIVEQLKGIRCPSTIRQRELKVTSCPDAIARVIEKVVKLQNGNANKEVQLTTEEKKKTGSVSGDAVCTVSDSCSNPEHQSVAVGKYCPDCGKIVEHEGGCVICRNCGYSKCG
ncbi:vitamin B12-dependent ribonucleotide reductase [Petroclostridium sp. X23]|uniref:vitamin B12-dependent ribonucleotide reductase n=1 Tax=Petroclostridium sp. X23 TaxID=3045146 RepID=UPI0024AE6C70|nr:vitamin B12-dependent ribonucleotide reductase [Petroclostridium sp. X23]WHH60988.1 vitamin B12-dependent ribonucleotide reductase [Petroclostridium sp. X23]